MVETEDHAWSGSTKMSSRGGEPILPDIMKESILNARGSVMKRKTERLSERPSPGEGRMFLQPLAVAAVSLVICTLFLVTAMLSSRRLEEALIEGLHARASSILQGIELLAERKFERWEKLLQAGNSDPFSLDPPLEELFSLREMLVSDLLATAAELDLTLSAGASAEAALGEILAAREISAIVLLEAGGKVARVAGRLPAGVSLPELSGLLPPGDNVAVRLWEDEPLSLACVGMRRADSHGAVFLFIERDGVRRWALRRAFREAAEEVGWREEVAYLHLEDHGGRGILSLGDAPEALPAIPAPAEGRMQRLPGKEGGSLEAARRIRVGGEEPFFARIGMRARGLDVLVRDHRRHAYLSAAMMVGLGLLAILLLSWNQNRHLRRTQELQRRLHQTERLSSLGQLAAAVAHEIRNPLNAVSLAIQRLQREAAAETGKGNPEETAKLLQTVRGEIRRLDRIVEDFLSLSRAGRLELRAVSLRGLLESLLTLLGEEAKTRNVVLEPVFPETDLVMNGDENRLRQALLNLLKNALEALPKGGSIRLALKPRPPGEAEIEVHDTGVGIPAASLAAVFDPDYTTKPGGLGLGLPIALQIIRAHGGELTVESEPGRGTTFTVRLPLAGRR